MSTCTKCGKESQICYGLYHKDGTVIKRFCVECAAAELEGK